MQLSCNREAGESWSAATLLKQAASACAGSDVLEPAARCLIGLEACATAHHWARGLRALGHEVRLMPPQYVKAYVKRNKNDAADEGRSERR